MRVERTALVRDIKTKSLKIFRYDDYDSQRQMAEDIRGNGFRVLKIWNGYKTDSEVDQWEWLNRIFLLIDQIFFARSLSHFPSMFQFSLQMQALNHYQTL